MSQVTRLGRAAGSFGPGRVRKLGFRSLAFSLVAVLFMWGCGSKQGIPVLGSPGAVGASVFVDGKLVGKFPSQITGSAPGDKFPLKFNTEIQSGDTHRVVVVTSSGDTLTGNVRPNDSGAIFIRPERGEILYL